MLLKVAIVIVTMTITMECSGKISGNSSEAMSKYRLLLHSAKQIVQVTRSNDVEYVCGHDDMNNIKILEDDGANLAILVDDNGKIAEIGTNDELMAKADEGGCQSRIYVNGGVIMPGFIDAHSHPVFAGDRVNEFAMKLAGASYMKIQEEGGGILYTMNKTREASEEELLYGLELISMEILKSGTTTLEAKSGYGLNTESELKMLNVIDMASGYLPVELSGTFCGGHAVPKGTTEHDQTNLIVNEMIPLIINEKNEGRLQTIENIDVFCEKGNFEVDSSRTILEAGKKAGLAINFHAEELNQIGGAEMGAEIGARAMSHLEKVSDNGIKAMQKSGTVAVLLPTTAYMLRLFPPPARKMIDSGVIVALGSDFNPNAYCYSMPMVMNLACVDMYLSMSEALIASTINAAHSLQRGKTHGSIHKGRNADLIVLDAPRWEHIIYQFGGHNALIKHVVKNGNVVYSKQT